MKEKRGMGRKVFTGAFVFLVSVVVSILGSLAVSRAETIIEKVTTPMGTELEIVIPETMGDKEDDTMRVRIKNYFFGLDTYSSDFIFVVQYELASERKEGSGGWNGMAVFLDKEGNVLNSIHDPGMLLESEAGRRVYDYDNETAKKLSKIVFLEHYMSPYDFSLEDYEAGWVASPDVKFYQPFFWKRFWEEVEWIYRPDDDDEKKSQRIKVSSEYKKTLEDTGFKLKPSGNIHTSLKFKSSNKKIATVKSYGSYGIVKLLKPGTVKITITAPETEEYESAKKTVTLKISLGKPKLKVSVKDGRMEIQWNKVKGAEKYQVNVIQHGVKTTMLQPMKETKISNAVTKGKKYTIQVRAIDSTKKYMSGWSKKTVRA